MFELLCELVCEETINPPEIPPTPWLSKRVDILMQDATRDVRDNCRIAELNRRVEYHPQTPLIK